MNNDQLRLKASNLASKSASASFTPAPPAAPAATAVFPVLLAGANEALSGLRSIFLNLKV